MHKAITIQNVFASIHTCVLELFVSCIVQTLGVARFRTVTVRSLVLNTMGSNTSNTKATQFFSATHLALSRDAKHNVCTVNLYWSLHCTADQRSRPLYTHPKPAPLLLHHINTPVL